MVRLALEPEESNWIKLDTWEMDQPNWSRTRSVLEHVKEAHTNEIKEPFRVMLVCGADLLESFSVPGLWQSEDVSKITDWLEY